MAPAPTTTEQQAAKPAKPLTGLALKVYTAQQEAATKSTKGKVVGEVTQQKDGSAVILFSMLDFINAIGKSDSGKTEGCTLQINGEFTVEIPDLGPVTYVIESNSWVKARVKVDQKL